MHDGINMPTLKEIAQVEACYPFRGRITEAPDGEVKVIQMKDVSHEGGVDWSGLISTNLEGRRTPHWLEAGDIVFMARGNRNFAIYLEEVPVRVVCSPLFFHIHIRTQDILPEFLAWQINQGPAQSYFGRSRMGTHQMSIRRSTLEELPVSVLELDKQKAVIALDRLMKEEQRLCAQLASSREQMMNSLARDLLI